MQRVQRPNRRRGSGVRCRVLDLKEPGKVNALAEGDRCATGRVRVYVDADVEILANEVEALISAVRLGGRKQRPPPHHPRDGVARMVAWYYDVWEALPSVREGLFGRGVIALSENGARRVRALQLAMNDDLAVSVAFESSERVVVESASVVVHPPRTLRDLVRRRTRVVTGNVQADGRHFVVPAPELGPGRWVRSCAVIRGLRGRS